MKKVILPLSIVALAFTGIATTASAQRYETRVPAPRIAVEYGRDSRAVYHLERLNREVRQVRLAIREAGGGGRRIRYRFDRIVRATDRLNFQFRRGEIRRWELRRRVDEIRSELYRIREELRWRRGRPHTWQ